MNNTDLKNVVVVEIHVCGSGGHLLGSAVRESAVLALNMDCRVILTFNEKQYVFEPELMLKQTLAEDQPDA